MTAAFRRLQGMLTRLNEIDPIMSTYFLENLSRFFYIFAFDAIMVFVCML